MNFEDAYERILRLKEPCQVVIAASENRMRAKEVSVFLLGKVSGNKKQRAQYVAAMERESRDYEKVVGVYDTRTERHDFIADCQAQWSYCRDLEQTAMAILRPNGENPGTVGILTDEYFEHLLGASESGGSQDSDDGSSCEDAQDRGGDSSPADPPSDCGGGEVQARSKPEGGEADKPGKGGNDWPNFGCL